MTEFFRKVFRRPVSALIRALVVSHLIGAACVSRSNRTLLQKLSALQDTGYRVIPNEPVMETLENLSPCVFGAVFFTLTVGLTLSALGFGAAWLEYAPGIRRPVFRFGLLLLWGAVLAWVNWNGFNPTATLFTAIVPPVAYGKAAPAFSRTPGNTGFRRMSLYLGGFFLVMAVAGGRMTPDAFSGLRDDWLLGNRPGAALTAFYYRYTLYAAEVFKSLSQRQIRSCHIFAGDPGDPRIGSLKRRLAAFDYLSVSGLYPAELEAAVAPEGVSLNHRGRLVVSAPVAEFMADPGRFLKIFSDRTDIHGPFRQMTFFSLILSVGMSVYLAVLWPCRLIVGRFLKNDLTAVAATFLTVGILLTVPAVSGREAEKKPVNPLALLSGDRAERLDALKWIAVSHGEIAAWQGYGLLADSRDVLDRFWLAKTLQFSRKPDTYPVVLALLNDPHIPVACRAYQALGNRGDGRAVEDIRARLPEIREWYVQLYAYKALRRLGWTQTAESR